MIPTSSHFSPFKQSFIKNLFVLIIIIPLIFSSTSHYIEAMRVHPMATKRNIATRDGLDFTISSHMQGKNAQKKLRRLPHVFSKVLELPFRSDADVAVEEGPDFFRFVAEIEIDGNDDGVILAGDVRAYAVEIHSGVIKIVIRNDDRRHDEIRGGGVDLLLDRLEVDTWRFRLPSSARPELAAAAFVNGELVVTVPKGGNGGGSRWRGVCGGNRLVLVQ